VKRILAAGLGFFSLASVAAAFGGAPALQPRMGEPLNDLSAPELQRFIDGKAAFERVFTQVDGLGPIFNKESCANCHNNPVGGSGAQTVTRFGVPDEKGGPFDPLESMGGSLLQAQSISEMCSEEVPNVPGIYTTVRTTPSTLGFGLIEAIEDADILASEDPTDSNADGVSGRAHMVQPLEGPPGLRVGRFGWKAQVATVLTFSGDAALNEMGITNDLVMAENAPNGDAGLLAMCDTVADPEDTGPVGTRFIDEATDFQRFLAAPPQTPASGMTGETIFTTIGCAVCHTPSFTTSDSVALEDAIRDKTIKPYSDFLLHDMGLLFDGIPQGDAEEGEIRTPPLWGLRVRDPMLHDASVAAGAFDSRVTAAIMAHGQAGSEAKPSVDLFDALNGPDTAAVIAFLDSLGRREFDHDGNGSIDTADQATFIGCFTGPGSFYTPDDPCSISDLDLDGNVDCDDYQGFEAAFLGDQGVLPIVSMEDFIGVLIGTVTDSATKCIADMDKNTANDAADIPDYVAAVLAGS
jgi:CxxC motif-containing protein (DUF1111 family)